MKLCNIFGHRWSRPRQFINLNPALPGPHIVETRRCKAKGCGKHQTREMLT